MKTPHPFSAEDLEEVSCTVCGGPAAKNTATRDALYGWPGELTLRHCPACHNTWLSPRPTEAAIGRAYAHRPDMNLAHLAGARDTLKQAQQGRVALLRPHLPAGGRVLDYGSGDGLFLLSMKEAGYRPVGFEVDETCRRIHQGEFGLTSLPVGPGDTSWWPVQNAAVHAVTFWASLEHVPHPAVTLAEAHRVLKPGGVVAVCVPNFAALERRLFGHHWHGLQLPLHLTHFSPASLRRALEQAGFAVDRLWCATTATSFTTSLRARWGVDLTAAAVAGRSPAALGRKAALRLLVTPFLKTMDRLGTGGTLLAIARKAEQARQ